VVPAATPDYECAPAAPEDLLTSTEQRHLALVADGLTAREAAKQVYVTEATVRTHRRNILMKLEANNFPHAVAIGFMTGILPPLEQP